MQSAPSDSCDLLLKSATVFDGLGSPAFDADIGITGDRISHVIRDGSPSPKAASEISVAGLFTAPGFIDIHTHSDFTVLFNPKMESSIHQGVTTELFGNCGMSIGMLGSGPEFTLEKRWAERGGINVSWGTIGGFLQRIKDRGVAINVGTLAGHGTIRKAHLGFENRPPTPAELVAMQSDVARAMTEGAFGLSTGLEYLPGGYAELPEICSLAEVARDAGGFYASHLRNEGDTLVECVAETLAVGEKTGIAVQLSHHKAEGQRNWGIVRTTLRMMQEARDRGMDVLTDQYPYTAYMTGLTVILLPGWANAGSAPETIERLKNPELRLRITTEIMAKPPNWELIKIGSARNRRDIQGLSLAEVARQDGKQPVDTALDLLIEEEGWVLAAHFAMSEEDVEAVLADPHTMIGSDGVSMAPYGVFIQDQIHPRGYGTFPRVIHRYVNERHVLSMQEAIRRMTSLPARRLGLKDRGAIAVGNAADIVVFDPNTTQDLSTFEQPHTFARGIEYVLVNGRIALNRGEQTDALAGAVLIRP